MTRLRTGLTHCANNQVHGLDDSILLRHQFSPNFSTDSVHSQLKYWQKLQKILQVDSIMYMEMQRTYNKHSNFENNKVGRLTLLDFKPHYEATGIKRSVVSIKIDKQIIEQNRGSRIDPNIYGQNLFKHV